MVVSNTSPLNYLILIGAAHLLPAIHGTVHVPRAVVDELTDDAAPQSVRKWMFEPPDWLVVHSDTTTVRPAWSHLHRGEAAAIALALEAPAKLLLIDDLDGRISARAAGLVIMGTLGVLDAAAVRGLADFKSLLAALKATNFRAAPKLVEALLLRHSTQEV